ncbi:hypothetical protein PR202_gb07863 [Eleusine coracana subsp. coracana]|uniref:Retrotransposon gag domain-containing protein n=1 Tax=Eleusine coracana subsp. coracana TaxID=191504 RepID=A0AAV5ED89_ELECO|nr:hypothetical protein PR202_gb07863 [Eleusine coracana subsp. coracana]
MDQSDEDPKFFDESRFVAEIGLESESLLDLIEGPCDSESCSSDFHEVFMVAPAAQGQADGKTSVDAAARGTAPRIDGHETNLEDGDPDAATPPLRRPDAQQRLRVVQNLDMGDFTLKLDGEDVFKTPQHNITAAATLLQTIEPLLQVSPELTPQFLGPLQPREDRRDRQRSNREATLPTVPRRRPIVEYHDRHPSADLRNGIPPRDARVRLDNRYQERDDAARREYEDERRRRSYVDYKHDNRWQPHRDDHYRDRRDEGRRDDRSRREAGRERERTPAADDYDEEASIRAFTRELQTISWPVGFKPVGIEKYDGKTDPRDWLHVYSIAIRALGGDNFVMANYLHVCLAPATRSWLTNLPDNSITSWADLYRQFMANFQAIFDRPGNHWELGRIKQRDREPL